MPSTSPCHIFTVVIAPYLSDGDPKTTRRMNDPPLLGAHYVKAECEDRAVEYVAGAPAAEAAP